MIDTLAIASDSVLCQSLFCHRIAYIYIIYRISSYIYYEQRRTKFILMIAYFTSIFIFLVRIKE